MKGVFMSENEVVPVDQIENIILVIRGQKVILDRDLAQLYNVTTKRLNEQVRRNRSRFPDDFIFRLTAKEKAKVVANCDHLSTVKFSPSLPYAFTEHGAIMAASVINSPRAIASSIFVVRAFVRLRKMVETHTELLQKVGELEDRLESHDEQIQSIFEAIRQLMMPPAKPRKKIGFGVKEKKAAYGRRGVKRKKAKRA
ncbi:MAG: ORF6N domain-containing protein [Proteobacteria bacterium]|nr:ORF6N domain-containing protein [Pseudomonadota bacterium]MBU4288145.1 ORF6N domain-containing protein [Pseudomonadota bacterium]MBU4414777.1 ORF6N domain-containing protein [Pseudomonadota bacterium]